MSISSDSVQISASSSETEDAATTLPAESLRLSFNAGREPKRQFVQNRRLLTDKIPYVSGRIKNGKGSP